VGSLSSSFPIRAVSPPLHGLGVRPYPAKGDTILFPESSTPRFFSIWIAPPSSCFFPGAFVLRSGMAFFSFSLTLRERITLPPEQWRFLPSSPPCPSFLSPSFLLSRVRTVLRFLTSRAFGKKDFSAVEEPPPSFPSEGPHNFFFFLPPGYPPETTPCFKYVDWVAVLFL